MKLLDIIWDGLKQGIRYKKLAFFILLIQLLLATLIGILSYNYVEGSIGNTTNLLKIIDGYNHDVFQDLLRFESTGWIMIKTFTVVIVILYLILGPFIMGGLLHVFKEKKDNWDSFWCGGSKYYTPFLKLNLLIMSILVVFVVLLGLLGVAVGSYGLNNYLSEIPIFWFTGFLLFMLLLIGITLVSISTKAKWEIMTEDAKLLKAFRQGVKQVFKKIWSYILLGLVFLLISFGFVFLMNFLINCIPESGFLLVLLALIIQIISLYLKVCLRNAYYSAIIKS